MDKSPGLTGLMLTSCLVEDGQVNDLTNNSFCDVCEIQIKALVHVSVSSSVYM